MLKLEDTENKTKRFLKALISIKWMFSGKIVSNPIFTLEKLGKIT